MTKSRHLPVLRHLHKLTQLPHWPSLLGVAVAGVVLGGCTQLGFATANLAADWSAYSRRTNLAYGPGKAQKADVYLPTHPNNCPVIVFFYGGGWNSGDKASYKFVGAALASAGNVVVVPNYTLYPKGRFPAFMQDAALAVAWTREHAAEWGGDPANLYVAGHSAGAHIAVLLSLDPEYLAQAGGSTHWLRGTIGLSGPYDFLPFTENYLNDLFGPPSEYWRSQPINYVHSDAPPMLLMHGTGDKRVSVNNTRSLEKALRASGDAVTALYFEGASHGDTAAALSIPARRRLPVLSDISAFVDQQTATDAAIH